MAERVLLLVREAQRGTAGDQDGEMRRGRQKLRDNRCSADKVLEIIEQEQRMLVAQRARQHRQRRSA